MKSLIAYLLMLTATPSQSTCERMDCFFMNRDIVFLNKDNATIRYSTKVEVIPQNHIILTGKWSSSRKGFAARCTCNGNPDNPTLFLILSAPEI